MTKRFEVQVRVTKVFTLDAEDSQTAEDLAMRMFDSAPFGTYEIDHLLEIGDASKDE